MVVMVIAPIPKAGPSVWILSGGIGELELLKPWWGGSGKEKEEEPTF